MLVFDRPWVLIAFALPLAYMFVRRLSAGRFGSIAFPLGGSPLPRVPFFMSALRLLRISAFWLGYLSAVIAAAGPSFVTHRIVYLERGAEIMLVLDVSPSMAASDFEPTRLDAAKSIIGEFLSARRNETVGLVAFGAEAALVCPPTADYNSLSSRLAELKSGFYGEETAIGSGIATALAHIARSSAAEKRIILLTDGESNAGSIDPLTAARSLRRYGVGLSVVGIGSNGDIPVTYTDPKTGEVKSGLYRSGFDRASMEELAAAGDGSYFPADDRAALRAAFSSLSKMNLSPLRSRSEGVEERLVGFFAALSLALMACARIVSLAGIGGRP